MQIKPMKFLPKYRLRDYDFLLIILVTALAVVGIFAISSADASLHNKQTAGVVVGFLLMIFISLLDYHALLKLSWLYYAFDILLLVLVFIKGDSSHGAQRWLNLFGITFQPTETGKILLILFFAAFIMKHKSSIKKLPFILVCVILFSLPLALVFMQPDLSSCIMMVLIFSTILFIGGISWKLVVAVLALVLPAVTFVMFDALQTESRFLKAYQQERILAWLHPEQYMSSTAYQTMNSMMAIGSGQLQGKGYDTNEISSVLNGGFVSESQTDFIFTVIGEEGGFIGSVAVVLLILLIALRCLQISMKANDTAGAVIAAGMACWIGLQGFMNIGVATGVMPNTGIPCPFVSSGLTSLVSAFGGVGFTLNVRLQSRRSQN